MLGNCVSLTVTVNEQADWLLLESLTVQDTVVVPFANAAPEGGVHTGAPTFGQLSDTTGAAYVTTDEQRFGSVGFVILAGELMPGGCVSLTVTVNEQGAEELPLVSVAVQVTVVVPF